MMIVKLFITNSNRYTFSCIANYALEAKIKVSINGNWVCFDVPEFRDFLSCVWKAFCWISRGICRDDNQDPSLLLSRTYYCSVIGYKDRYFFRLDWEDRCIRYGVY